MARFNKASRGRRKQRFRGTNVEVNRKRIPRISTINKKVKKLERSTELKYHDTLYSTLVDNDGDVQLLNGIAVGDNQITREGAEIMPTSLQIRGSVTASSTALVATHARLLIIWDRQSNGTQPEIATDPLTSGTPALLNDAVVIDLVNAPFQYETQDRFRVLYDKRFTLNPQVVLLSENGDTSNVVPVSVQFKKKIKLNRRVKYDTTAGDIASINSNSLYAIFISSQATSTPRMTVGFRLYFKDN